MNLSNTTDSYISNFRGGVAEKCDFCGQVTSPEDIHPEEAGQWICIKCIPRIWGQSRVHAFGEIYYDENPDEMSEDMFDADLRNGIVVSCGWYKDVNKYAITAQDNGKPLGSPIYAESLEEAKAHTAYMIGKYFFHENTNTR